MTPVIEIDGLRKEYRRRRRLGAGQARQRNGSRRVAAIDGLDLSVPEGGVFGFLGPNGSGKTTTIRCLLGLVRPTSGTARLFGEDVRVGLPSAIRRVGSIVETPMFFPTMSARENLRLLAAVDRIPAARVDAMLERVGLGERADDDVRRFSLGMRQRLGLAAALLKDPALVILDEPANGLDPAGMREVRDVLRALGAEGRTVLVSSHLLAEVEQTCDRVAILKRGRCVATGTVDEVLGRADGEMLVRVADLAAGAAALGRAGIAVERCDDHLLARVGPDDGGRVTEVLAAERLWVSELRIAEHSLEERFLELTAPDELPHVLEVVGVNLLVIEMRRALQRRLIRVLILLALVMIVIAGVVEFFASQGLDLVALAVKDHHDPAVMADWWLSGAGGDGVLAVAALFLVLGGLLGGASVVGAEWRAGTVTTVLTWEPRRVRLHAARIASSGLLATAIALALQALLLAAFVPSVLAHGTTAGVDAEWVGSLVAAMARIGLITGLAAMLGGALATLGRNTVAAIIVAWGWLAIGESMLRGGFPEYAKWLVGDTTTVVLMWTPNGGDGSTHSPVVAVAMLLTYTAVLVMASGYTFWRRDVAGSNLSAKPSRSARMGQNGHAHDAMQGTQP